MGLVPLFESVCVCVGFVAFFETVCGNCGIFRDCVWELWHFARLCVGIVAFLLFVVFFSGVLRLLRSCWLWHWAGGAIGPTFCGSIGVIPPLRSRG